MRVCAVYYTGGSILFDNMQPLMSKADIKGTHLNDPKAQTAWAGDCGGAGARAHSKRRVTIAAKRLHGPVVRWQDPAHRLSHELGGQLCSQ